MVDYAENPKYDFMSDQQILGGESSLPSSQEQQDATNSMSKIENTDNEMVASVSRDEQFTAGHETPEIATNDGSVIETLDTTLHGTPGWSEGENISGSNRADYYEARSYGKTDVEEELEDLRERNRPVGDNDKK